MLRDDFLKYQAKTTPCPMGMEVKRAKGCYIIDQKGKKHLDFVAGVSACSIGHRHPAVVRAMKNSSTVICMSWFMENMHKLLR